VKAVAEAATASLESTLAPQVQVARDQIDAIAPESATEKK
jgi:hypothetical protein